MLFAVDFACGRSIEKLWQGLSVRFPQVPVIMAASLVASGAEDVSCP